MPGRRRIPLAAALALFAALASAAGAWAETERFPLEPADTSSPRATLGSFLAATEDAYRRGDEGDRQGSREALRRALSTLDTSALPPRFANDRGTEAALMLREILDRLALPPLADVPGEEVTSWRIPRTEISIARVDGGPRAGRYLFSADTVKRAGSFYERVRHLPYREGALRDIYQIYLTTPGAGLVHAWSDTLPAWSRTVIADQAAWQWIATAILLLATAALVAALLVLGGAVDRRPLPRKDDRALAGRRASPAMMTGLVAAAALTFLAQYVADQVINLTGTVLEVVTYLLDLAGYVLVGWLAVLVVMNLAHLFIRMRGLDPDAATGRLIRVGAAALSVIVLVALFVYAGQAFGLPAYSIVTGLGVGGIAIGFGAQTLVRDIFSGIFFLVDDAFRPGEYIDTGVAKGFVERVSIRSVQLRHHNGPLQTIPFGEIKKVNNFSRDWVVMKLTFRVPFGTDTERVRKLIKTLGMELQDDPELGPKFIEPLKSQGVYEIDDFGIVMRVKFMTRPGEQFTLRRTVYVKLQELFRREGIEFAGREVRVRGEDAADTVALAGRASELGAESPAADRGAA